MPANLVKSPRDEHLWEEAKKAYEKHEKDHGPLKNKWAYVTKIFMNMKKGKAHGETMQKPLRDILAEAVIQEFIVQADAIITALDEPPAKPQEKPQEKRSVKRSDIQPEKDLHPASKEAKDFIHHTNMLVDLEAKLKHAMSWMNSYSAGFSKELKNTMKLYESKKDALKMGDVWDISMLVDAVQKVLQAVDNVASRFETLQTSTKKLRHPDPQTQTLSPKDPNNMGLSPITDVEEDLNLLDQKDQTKRAERKAKFHEFFKDIKNKFGQKPHASVLMGQALIRAAQTIAEEK